GLDEHRATLTIGATTTTIDAGLLDLFWFGEAHVLWRDFEGLGMTFGLGARGAHVARLQALLRRAGLFAGESTGEFDPATVAAVLDFQRSRLLVPDARVGRLTRIVLYAAAGGRPAAAGGGARREGRPAARRDRTRAGGAAARQDGNKPAAGGTRCARASGSTRAERRPSGAAAAVRGGASHPGERDPILVVP